VAEAAAKANSPGVAKSATDAALTAAGKATDPGAQSLAYAAVAAAAAGAGLIELAQKAAEGIPKESFAKRSSAVAALAQALARAGLFNEARIACEDCERLDKLRTYTTILNEYTKRHPPRRR
jgi:hypothetical protein